MKKLWQYHEVLFCVNNRAKGLRYLSIKLNRSENSIRNKINKKLKEEGIPTSVYDLKNHFAKSIGYKTVGCAIMNMGFKEFERRYKKQ